MSHNHEHAAHAADNYIVSTATWARVRNATLFVAIASWLGVALGWATQPEAFYQNYLVAFLFGITTAIGATFFVMVQHLTGAAWSVTVRRLMEALMRTLPLFVVLFAPLPLGLHYLYDWSHATAAHDKILAQKLGYLNAQWFSIRGFGVIALLSLFALVLYSKSRQQDADGALRHTFSSERWSAPGVLVLFLGASLCAFDWVMSLDAHWYSTMFGVIFLSGGAVSFMATLIIVCLWLRANGYLQTAVNTEHYHDLGKWLFALMVFWAYVSFSQYMLMWYGNMPEETVWFLHRLHGSWLYVSLLLVGGNFLMPLFVMLPRAVKRHRGALAFFAGWLLLMHYVDLYWQVMPVFAPHGVPLHWLAPVSVIAVVSSQALVFWSAFRERPLIAVQDPRLKQSLAFHNA